MVSFNEADFHNVLALISFGFKNGIVKSQDHAKVLLVLEDKVKKAITPIEDDTEVEDGNDIPGSD